MNDLLLILEINTWHFETRFLTICKNFVSSFIIGKLGCCIFLAYKSKKGSLALQCTYNFLDITVIIIGYYRNYNCGKTIHTRLTELVVSESQ